LGKKLLLDWAFIKDFSENLFLIDAIGLNKMFDEV
jgi:hypothetical protein